MIDSVYVRKSNKFFGVVLLISFLTYLKYVKTLAISVLFVVFFNVLLQKMDQIENELLPFSIIEFQNIYLWALSTICECKINGVFPVIQRKSHHLHLFLSNRRNFSGYLNYFRCHLQYKRNSSVYLSDWLLNLILQLRSDRLYWAITPVSYHERN